MLELKVCFLLMIIYIIATPNIILSEESKETVIANNGSTEIENATLSPNGNDSSPKQTTSKNLTTTELDSSNKTKLEIVTPEYLGNVNNMTKENYTEIPVSENVNSTDSVHINDTDFQSAIAIEEKNQNFTKIPDKNITNLIDNVCPDFISSNDYVDRMIEKIVENISGEIPLPDKSGFFILTDGKLRGLKYMKRIGDAKVTCGPPMTLEALLRFEELTVKYTWRKQTIFSILRGRVFLITNETDILFGIKQKGSKAYLDKFMIKDIRGIKTEVTGLSYLTWALSRLTSPVINIFRQTMGLIITGPFREAFAQEIENMDFPYI